MASATNSRRCVEYVLNKGVPASLHEDPILVIEGPWLPVRVIRGRSIDPVVPGLVEEKLANVVDISTTGEYSPTVPLPVSNWFTHTSSK